MNKFMDFFRVPFQKKNKERISVRYLESSESPKTESFPGYCNILINHRTLQRIIRNDDPEWKNPLSNIKGVFCITDLALGTHFIGSASGKSESIWRIWKRYAYVNDLTRGNEIFKELKNKGADHIVDNFQYSVIEVFNMNIDRKTILHREEYWKDVFQSVKYGMNN